MPAQNERCTFCGKPGGLLCDGRIVQTTDGSHRVGRSVKSGVVSASCDAPMCRACAHKISNVHLNIRGGCRWDTIDLCPDCVEAEAIATEAAYV